MHAHDRTLTVIVAGVLAKLNSSVSTTSTPHSATTPAATAATLMSAPPLVPTARLNNELVAPGGRVMIAPAVQPPAADHA